MIPPSTTITERGKRTRKALLWLGGLVVALNVVVWVANSLTTGGSVSGPSGSSYVTRPGGAAALAGTLDRLGTEVIRSRTELDGSILTPDATLALIDVGPGDFGSAELASIKSFIAAGGRLVVVGDAAMVPRLLADAPAWSSAGSPTARPVVPSPVSSVSLSSFGSLVDLGSGDEPLLSSGDGRVIAMSRGIDSGQFVWMADTEPFRNAGIGRGDNGAVAIALLGPGRPVVFDEFRHGYSEHGGLWQSLPVGWRTAVVLGGLTLLAGLVAYGRRFGPPHDQSRRLGPSRSEYFGAMASLLSRSRAIGDATSIIRAEAQRLLRSRLGDDVPESSLVATGLGPEEIDAVMGTGTEVDDLMAVDRALANLSQEQR